MSHRINQTRLTRDFVSSHLLGVRLPPASLGIDVLGSEHFRTHDNRWRRLQPVARADEGRDPVGNERDRRWITSFEKFLRHTAEHVSTKVQLSPKQIE
jgi:hypothetical protein